MKRLLFVGLVATGAAVPHPVHAASVVINADKDNTLYAESDTLSNGAGQRFFAGVNGQGSVRRGLVKFTMSVPAGATIDSVVLRLNLAQTGAGSVMVNLHRLTANWGEGTSLASGGEGGGAPATGGDATWSWAFYGGFLPWPTPGGSYEAAASASRPVGAVGAYTWRSAGMVSDVAYWMANPALNFGWEVIGDEAGPGTAKAFNTRQALSVANRPTLTVYYREAPTPAGSLPTATRLFPVQPNPFNPTATIRYQLARDARVRVVVHDAAGRQVRVLVDDVVPAGMHAVLWHGQGEGRERVASGVYFVRLTAGNAPAQVEKMVLLK